MRFGADVRAFLSPLALLALYVLFLFIVNPALEAPFLWGSAPTIFGVFHAVLTYCMPLWFAVVAFIVARKVGAPGLPNGVIALVIGLLILTVGGLWLPAASESSQRQGMLSHTQYITAAESVGKVDACVDESLIARTRASQPAWMRVGASLSLFWRGNYDIGPRVIGHAPARTTECIETLVAHLVSAGKSFEMCQGLTDEQLRAFCTQKVSALTSTTANADTCSTLFKPGTIEEGECLTKAAINASDMSLCPKQTTGQYFDYGFAICYEKTAAASGDWKSCAGVQSRKFRLACLRGALATSNVVLTPAQCDDVIAPLLQPEPVAPGTGISADDASRAQSELFDTIEKIRCGKQVTVNIPLVQGTPFPPLAVAQRDIVTLNVTYGGAYVSGATVRIPGYGVFENVYASTAVFYASKTGEFAIDVDASGTGFMSGTLVVQAHD